MDRKTIGLLSTVPVLLLTFFFFIIPIVGSFWNSLHYQGSFTFYYYEFLFNNAEFMAALMLTVKIAVITTAVSAALAIIISLAIRSTTIGKKFISFIYQLNISIPALMVALLMLIIFTDSGYIVRIGICLGLVDSTEYVRLLIPDDTGLGTIIAYSWKFVPFIGITVLSTLQTTSVEYEDQSRTLGVGPLRTFLHVTMPTIVVPVCSTSLIVFAFCFGSYDIPSLLGTGSVLSTLAYNYYFNSLYTDAKTIAYAITSIISLIMVLCASTYLFLSIPKGERKV